MLLSGGIMFRPKIFFVIMISLGFNNAIASEERLPCSQDTVLEEWNHFATLLYEQAFFCELLMAIIQTRRTDEFHADVLQTCPKINAMVLRSLENDSLKFDSETPPHEKLFISNIYYTFRYLVRQKTYKLLLPDFHPETDTSLSFLQEILKQLDFFIHKKNKSPQKELLLSLYSLSQTLDLVLTQYRTACTSLRSQYTNLIMLIRAKIIVQPQFITNIFHQYLDKPKKILPVFLHTSRETQPVDYSLTFDSQLHEWPPETLEEPFRTLPMKKKGRRSELDDFPCSPIEWCNSPKPDDESTSARPGIAPAASSTSQSTASNFNLQDLLFAYDFQEYWFSYLSSLFNKPEELKRAGCECSRAYTQSCTTFNKLFRQMDSLEKLSTTGHLQAEFVQLQLHLQALAENTRHIEQNVSVLANLLDNDLVNRSKQ